MRSACYKAEISNRQAKPRGRLPGVEVDSSRIRQARLDAGLSMAKLAEPELTRQAIFLIEAGQTRPTMPTLEIIARRTGKPIEYFLPVSNDSQPAHGQSVADARVEELQAFCLQQQFASAITLGLEMIRQPMSRRLEAYVRQYLGQALIRSSRPDEGLEHIRRAQALLEVEPDPWLAVECGDWEASALYLKEDSRALAVAERTLELCRTTEPRLPGTEARILEHIASIHVKNHSFERAIDFYEQALRAAGAVRDLPRLGRTYHGLSIAYQQRGDLAKAVEYTHKALALYALEHDTALLARGENELGLLLMRQGQMARAQEAFHSALSRFEAAGTEVAKSHILLSLGELQLRTGHHRDGIETVKKAIDMAKRLDERLAVASGHELMGRLLEKVGRRDLADKEFRLALKLLRVDGARDRLAETHAVYAEVLEARSDNRSASRHWKEAAKLALGRQPLDLPAARAV
jgi:tetratricopeptide (TPR) repeat protein